MIEFFEFRSRSCERLPNVDDAKTRSLTLAAHAIPCFLNSKPLPILYLAPYLLYQLREEQIKYGLCSKDLGALSRWSCFV